MSKNELERILDLPTTLPYKERVEELQQILIDTLGDAIDTAEPGKRVVYPSETKYNHYFSGGLYVREMFCTKNYLGFTGIHNTANPLFLMKGKVAFSTEDGIQELTAPTFVFTSPGTKRIVLWLEDSVIVTVHPNPDGLTNLDQIEEKMFSSTWEQYNEDFGKDTWQMMEHKEYRKKKNNEENK